MRLKEHQDKVRLKKTDVSELAAHVTTTGHKIDWNQATIIDSDKDTRSRTAKETYYIRREHNVMNGHESFIISNAW